MVTVQKIKYLMSIKILKSLLPFFFLGMLFPSVFGQQELTLDQAIEIGLRNNFQIQIAEKQIEIARNNNDWGAAGRSPEVNLNIFYNNNFGTSNNPVSYTHLTLPTILRV